MPRAQIVTYPRGHSSASARSGLLEPYVPILLARSIPASTAARAFPKWMDTVVIADLDSKAANVKTTLRALLIRVKMGASVRKSAPTVTPVIALGGSGDKTVRLEMPVTLSLV